MKEGEENEGEEAKGGEGRIINKREEGAYLSVVICPANKYEYKQNKEYEYSKHNFPFSGIVQVNITLIFMLRTPLALAQQPPPPPTNQTQVICTTSHITTEQTRSPTLQKREPPKNNPSHQR